MRESVSCAPRNDSEYNDFVLSLKVNPQEGLTHAVEDVIEIKIGSDCKVYWVSPSQS